MSEITSSVPGKTAAVKRRRFGSANTLRSLGSSTSPHHHQQQQQQHPPAVVDLLTLELEEEKEENEGTGTRGFSNTSGRREESQQQQQPLPPTATAATATILPIGDDLFGESIPSLGSTCTTITTASPSASPRQHTGTSEEERHPSPVLNREQEGNVDHGVGNTVFIVNRQLGENIRTGTPPSTPPSPPPRVLSPELTDPAQLEQYSEAVDEMADIRCPVCIEPFVAPVTLPCNHNLCRCHIEDMSEFDRKPGEERGAGTGFSVVCPKCREVCHFESSDHVQVNHEMSALVTAVLKLLKKQVVVAQSPPTPARRRKKVDDERSPSPSVGKEGAHERSPGGGHVAGSIRRGTRLSHQEDETDTNDAHQHPVVDGETQCAGTSTLKGDEQQQPDTAVNYPHPPGFPQRERRRSSGGGKDKKKKRKGIRFAGETASQSEGEKSHSLRPSALKKKDSPHRRDTPKKRVRVRAPEEEEQQEGEEAEGRRVVNTRSDTEGESGREEDPSSASAPSSSPGVGDRDISPSQAETRKKLAELERELEHQRHVLRAEKERQNKIRLAQHKKQLREEQLAREYGLDFGSPQGAALISDEEILSLLPPEATQEQQPENGGGVLGQDLSSLPPQYRARLLKAKEKEKKQRAHLQEQGRQENEEEEEDGNEAGVDEGESSSPPLRRNRSRTYQDFQEAKQVALKERRPKTSLVSNKPSAISPSGRLSQVYDPPRFAPLATTGTASSIGTTARPLDLPPPDRQNTDLDDEEAELLEQERLYLQKRRELTARKEREREEKEAKLRQEISSWMSTAPTTEQRSTDIANQLGSFQDFIKKLEEPLPTDPSLGGGKSSASVVDYEVEAKLLQVERQVRREYEEELTNAQKAAIAEERAKSMIEAYKARTAKTKPPPKPTFVPKLYRRQQLPFLSEGVNLNRKRL